MPQLDPAQQAHLEERRAASGDVLLWLTGRNRATGVPESIGFWTGDDHAEHVVDGETRFYFGAGAVIDVGVVRAGVGFDVRYHQVTLPPVLPEVRQALRGYEARQAEVEVHVLPRHPETERPIGTPRRMIKGRLENAPEALGADQSKVTLKIASSARRLTIGLPLFKSNAALQLRNPADRGREYSDTVEEWSVKWGA